MTTNIYTLLSEYRLGEAISSLQSKIDNIRDASITEQFYILLDNYRAYLRAQVQQTAVFSSKDIEPFYRQAYAINDRANRRIRLYKSPNDQYSLATGTTDSMFNRVWASDLWDETEKSNVCLYVESTPNQYPVIVSAVTLALCEMFDEKKLMYLFDAYSSENEIVSLRALVGLIIVLRRYDSRISHYPQVTARFSLLSESETFVRQFISAHIVLQYCRMTDSVSEKMRNDIIPALLNSSYFSKKEMGREEIGKVLSGNGENPEWTQSFISDKKAEKKIRQMAKLQTEGADIYMTTFRHLKNFQFFNSMQNWFEPFSYGHPQLEACKRSRLIDGIISITPFSDSDRYSFILMLNQMGDTGSNAILSQIEQQLPDDMSIKDIIKDANEDRDDISSGKNAEKILRRYSQDLYRFFTLYPYRSQFFNPFDHKFSTFTPLHRESFVSVLSYHDELLILAEFLMRKGIYADALEIFKLALPKITGDERADILQKMGFCEQKSGNIREAYYYLFEADGIKPRSHWTVLHLFQTTFELKIYDEAIKYLDMLIEESPDDMDLHIKKSECLFALDRFQEAVPILYKVVYLDDDNLKGHQMLAWALLKGKEFEKSAKEYSKCAEAKDHSAYIYLGHIEVGKGNHTKACEYYRNALNIYCSKSTNQQVGQEAFLKTFHESAAYISWLDCQTLSLLLDNVLLN